MAKIKDPNYLDLNRRSWNDRVDIHMASEFYDMKGFMEGKTSLNPIELNMLGNIEGKSVLHLQCHFGQDSISLSRMGAKVTGVDLSDKAIDRARELAERCGTSARFICCDLYSLPEHLDEHFDVVFTSYGTIGWLPDLKKWARVVSRYLKPGGKFIFAEFHPVVWMFDDHFKKVAYNYFNDGPIIEKEEGTYAHREADLNPESVTWNHSISEVVNNLIQAGLHLEELDEFDYSPYNCFRETTEPSPGKYRIKHLQGLIPMVYTIKAVKKRG